MVFFKVRNRIKLTVIFCIFCSLKAKTKQSKTKTQKNLHPQGYFVFDDKEFLIHTKLSLLGHKFKWELYSKGQIRQHVETPHCSWSGLLSTEQVVTSLIERYRPKKIEK